MASFRIPFAKKSLLVRIPDCSLAGVLESKVNAFDPRANEGDLVDLALDHPIGSPNLEELARGKRRAVVVTSDHTRPVPSKITLPILLKRLRSANPSIEILVLVSTGFHRATTQQELADKFGQDIVERETFLIHDSKNRSTLVHLGKLPSGGALWLHRAAVETDLLIAEG
ncbi:MAG TPA: lactate racemase domain-containing protein, partial [bacterium]